MVNPHHIEIQANGYSTKGTTYEKGGNGLRTYRPRRTRHFRFGLRRAYRSNPKPAGGSRVRLESMTRAQLVAVAIKHGHTEPDRATTAELKSFIKSQVKK